MIDFILVEPENSGNVGAVARALANFGFERLILVDPKCNLDLEFRKRAKHSKVKVLTRKSIGKYSMLIGTTARINTDYNLDRLPIFADKLSAMEFPAKTAVVFGRESEGLTNEEINSCDVLVTINSSKDYSTLNLSHAVAIIAYELSKNEKNKIGARINIAGSSDKKQVHKLIGSIISSVKVDRARRERYRKLWKNVINKAMITTRESQGMMGLLRNIERELSKKK
ncbi:hypothetical protein H6503_03395 [Candidatus Woesearchaeota archaeon]|nr:hypothetical protein [Candidatus Woesearchaeota archaeon]